MLASRKVNRLFEAISRLAENGVPYSLILDSLSADVGCMTPSRLTKFVTSTPSMLVWGGAVAIGMAGLFRYQMTPGAQGREAPHSWPAGLGDIVPKPGRFTLLMTLHPQCPCSRASLHELSQLMTRAREKMDAHVLLVKPQGAPANWCNGDLWKQAKDIPSVSVSIDDDGKDASILGATTSGQVIVYDASGAIRFSGGITDGRGHEGDNAGLSALLGLIHGGKTTVSTTPVYGCSLGVCRLKKQ